ncbi:LytTR family DNA-binding domain-containing protein [Algoriphagus halophytocola]|uniref:LytR/AlgR family response regulator transcription factor n=1 Tax=Algoriphagus halophytocola TaxID=2991499 RepID=UPI0022DD083E|nr:LytTR family DNA-binding domain-containing protein [Algoriphagus sp. TR-M9]WBL44275.1 LytTR family DNA-binding domain-containing protein [Algoriphagus sp. TR-M9]
MEKLRIALIDDEQNGLITLKEHVERSEWYELAFMTTDPVEGWKRLANGEADILITDIVMDQMDGIHLAGLVGKLNIPVILCSAHDQYGYEGYQVNAVHFIKKPATYPDFIKGMDKVELKSISKNAVQEPVLDGMLALFEHKNTAWVMIAFADILYVKQDKNYSEITTLRKKYLTLGSLTGLKEKLPSNQFHQIHRSYLVNIQQIDFVKSDHLKLFSGDELPIGRAYSNDFTAIFKKISL